MATLERHWLIQLVLWPWQVLDAVTVGIPNQRREPRELEAWLPPAPPVQPLSRPAEPALKQLRVEDDRPLADLEAERNQLVDAIRQKRLANVQQPGNVTLVAEVKALEERARWLEDQWRRKKAAIRNGLSAA